MEYPFVVMNLRKLKRLVAVVIGLALLIVGSLTYDKLTLQEDPSQLVPASTTIPASSGAVMMGKTSDKVMALTFDLSWGTTKAEPIVKFLVSEKLPATFFINGTYATSHPDVVQMIAAQGFEIGSHGNKHDYYAAMKTSEVRKQLLLAQEQLTKVTQRTPRYVRMPNGSFNEATLKQAKRIGLTLVQWNIDTLDWMGATSDQISERIMTQLSPGSIVRMHASDSGKNTLEALHLVVPRLRELGYTFVTVSNLVEQTTVQSRVIQQD